MFSRSSVKLVCNRIVYCFRIGAKNFVNGFLSNVCQCLLSVLTTQLRFSTFVLDIFGLNFCFICILL